MLQEDKKMKKEMAGQLHHVLTSIIVNAIKLAINSVFVVAT